MMLPEGLPRSIRQGLIWVVCAAAIAGWIGFEPPWTSSGRQLDEWVKAHAVATAQIEEMGRSIVVLQDRETRTQNDLKSVGGRLDEIIRMLYAQDRRTR